MRREWREGSKKDGRGGRRWEGKAGGGKRREGEGRGRGLEGPFYGC